MSEIKKYKKYLNFKANPRYLRRDFIVPLYTGTEPDIVPEASVEQLETVQEFNEGGSVERQGYGGAGQVTPLPKEMQKVFKLRYPDKEWEDLEGYQRGNFKADFLRQQKILKSIPKDYITINELAEKLDVSQKSLYETRTNLAKFINEKLKPMVFGSIRGGTTESGTKAGGSVKYFKNPSPRLLNKILEMKETDFQIDTLKSKTIKNVNKLYNDYLDVYKKGKLPLIEEIKNMTPGEAGVATTRLAQILDGKKFRNKGLENIRINRNIASKIFEELNKHPFGNPYRSNLYKISLDTIDQKLGNKKGTFDSLKKEAVKILKDAKIPVYSARSKNPKGFNINEIAGVSGSARSKAAEFSQFVDIMEGELNQKQLASFQSALSRARVNIEENPATFNKQMRHINALASSFEEEYKVKLPRIRPATQVGRYYNQERLAELNKLGLDIKAASERAGYTIQMPKGAVTIQEFINNPEIKDQMIANIGCPTLVSKSIGGRVNFSNGSNCYAKGLEKIQSGELNQAERRIAGQFLKEAGADTKLVSGLIKGGKDALRLFQEFTIGTGPVGMGVTAALTVPFALADLAEGKRGSEALSNATFGLIGRSEEDILKGIGGPKVSQGLEIENKYKRLEELENQYDNLENQIMSSFPPDDIMSGVQKRMAPKMIESEKKRLDEEYNKTLDYLIPFLKKDRSGLDPNAPGYKELLKARELKLEEQRLRTEAGQARAYAFGISDEIPQEEDGRINPMLEKSSLLEKQLEEQQKKYYENQQDLKTILQPEVSADDYLMEYQQYMSGGRVHLGEGGGGPKLSRRGFLGFLMGAASLPFAGKLMKGKKAIQAAKVATKVVPKVAGMPEWFPSLIARIEKEGIDISPKAQRVEDIVKVKKLEVPVPGEKKPDIITMRQYPDGKIEIEADVYGGAFDSPFELQYNPPKTDINLETGQPIKYPGDFTVVENRPRPVYDPHSADYEIDYENMNVENAISDIERVEKIATGKRIHPKRVAQREKARADVEDRPYEDIINRYGDAGDNPDWWDPDNYD